MIDRRASWLLLALLATGCKSADAPVEQLPQPVAIDPAALAAAENDPTYQQHRQQFMSLFRSGNHSGALDEARAALATAPVLRDPYVWVSRLCTQLGRNEEAIRFFGTTAEQNPGLALPWFYKGFNEYHLSRFDDALESFRRASELDPTDAESLYRQGMILHIRADFPGAAVVLRRSYELDPTSAETAAKLSDVLRIEGSYDEAQAVVTEGLVHSPDSGDLHYALGLLLLHSRDDAGAETEFRRAIEIDPELREPHEHLARLLFRAGREDEADYERAISDRLQDYDKTRRTLEHRLADARDASIPMLLAEVELTRGKFDQALRWFRRAQRLGGHAERIAAGIAEAMVRSGDLDGGDGLLARLDGVETGRVDLARAARALAAGNSATALALLDGAVSRGPQERQFLRRASDLYAQAGGEATSRDLLFRAGSARPLSTAPD